MDERDYHNGARFCVANAKRLSRSARLLAESAEYGPAVALLVLSAEEAIKAALYIGLCLGVDPTDGEINSHLSHHRPRFVFIRALMTIAHYAPKDILDVDEMEYEELVVSIIEKVVVSFLDDNLPEELKVVRNWWADADRLKQSGLYVDFRRGVWAKPGDLAYMDYEKAIHMLEPVLTGARIGWCFLNRAPDELAKLSNLDLERLSEKLEKRFAHLEQSEPTS